MYLERKDLPQQIRHLAGKGLIRVHAVTAVSIPSDAGTWSGGTREIFEAVELATGRAVSITDTFSAPWDAGRTAGTITLKPGYAIAKTGSFCGKPAGLTLYACPDDLAPLLPAPASLTVEEQRVIEVTCAFKSGYRAFGLSPQQLSQAKASLVAKGMLLTSGAVTVKGRNARSPTH